MPLLNLNAESGMCEGSKAIVRRVLPICVGAGLFAEKKSGHREFTHHVPLQAPDSGLPFTLSRYQFPLLPCFGITVNKSKRKTTHRVGL